MILRRFSLTRRYGLWCWIRLRFWCVRMHPSFWLVLNHVVFCWLQGLARQLDCGVIMIRKKGKLPGAVLRHTYDLEYGSDCLEVQSDLIATGTPVVVVDDVLATGGTLSSELLFVDILRVRFACRGNTHRAGCSCWQRAFKPCVYVCVTYRGLMPNVSAGLEGKEQHRFRHKLRVVTMGCRRRYGYGHRFRRGQYG